MSRPLSTASTSATPPAAAVLQELLLRNHRDHHIEYRDYLSNHLVHHLGALYFLGASGKRLEECYAKHSELEPSIPTDERVTDENWEQYLGAKRNYCGLVSYFTSLIDKQPLSAVLSNYIPRLIPGIHGAALHPLIHLGYACELNCPIIFAEALAYCTFAYLRVLGPTAAVTSAGDLTILEILDRVRRDERLKEETIFGAGQGKRLGFQKKVAQVVQNGSGILAKYGAMWKQDVDPSRALHELIKAVTVLLPNTCRVPESRPGTPQLDFFVLHGLTSTYAVQQILQHRDLQPLFQDQPELQGRLLREEWMSLLVVYVTQGRPEIDLSRQITHAGTGEEAWAEIRQLGIRTNDEHATKAVHSLWQWRQQFAEIEGEPDMYLRAALAVKQMVMDIEIEDGSDNWNYKGVGW
ncbi:hypothetical protein HDU87_000658 [Geranomyces variabilis]|uniref:Oxidoreductase AflY n=1 Tax=Geranomyces variabilis TaxID=109894 RepID=A0AAD5TD82_9FUNG|nr:hypothetical protein HDU87_000658 [Geranomyces variabilis]